MYFFDNHINAFLVEGLHDIPVDAIAVSDNEYGDLVAKRDIGCLLYVDDNQVKATPPQPSPAHEWNGKDWVISPAKQTALLTEKRDSLIEQIDSHAATIYSTWTRFESEYRERQTAAEAYKAANYQGECSRYITDFAKRAGLDNKTATNLILTQAAGLEKLQVELANQRMRKYELKAPGLTLEQMQVTYDDIIKQMDHLMEAYNNG
jgi:hypothetical protein|nr:MAG TPA: hypothetical protein [Caudoviricetes sp.]